VTGKQEGQVFFCWNKIIEKEWNQMFKLFLKKKRSNTWNKSNCFVLQKVHRFRLLVLKSISSRLSCLFCFPWGHKNAGLRKDEIQEMNSLEQLQFETKSRSPKSLSFFENCWSSPSL
jgi:hypothetical protein